MLSDEYTSCFVLQSEKWKAKKQGKDNNSLPQVGIETTAIAFTVRCSLWLYLIYYLLPIFSLSSRCIPHIAGRQREPGNVVSVLVSFQLSYFCCPLSGKIIRHYGLSGGNSTPRFASLPERANENIKDFLTLSGNRNHNSCVYSGTRAPALQRSQFYIF